MLYYVQETRITIPVKGVSLLIDIIVKDGDIHLKSEYNNDIVKFMRTRQKRFWDTNRREWVIPESEMENLIEVIGNFEYKISYPDKNKKQLENSIPEWYNFKTTPFPHQVEGISFGLSHSKFLLADEQGLGKTAQVINLACILKKEKNIQHVLIIACVNGLKYNWYEEVSKHSNESAYILGTRMRKNGNTYIGSNEDRLEDLKLLGTGSEIDKHFFIITNIETLRFSRSEQIALKTKKNGIQRYKKVTKFPIVEQLQKLTKNDIIGMIAVDELHRACNSTSIQGKALLSLTAENMVALTGTPIMNNPIDAYLPLAWLGYEKHSLWAFQKHHCIMGGFGSHQIVGYRNLEDIQSQLDKCMLRRLKKDVLDLPEKIYINDYVEMTKEQAKLYDEVKNDITEHIDQIELSPNPLTLLIRLRQVTGNPNILSSTIKGNPKFDRMMEIIEDVVSNGGKALVFSNWLDVLLPAYELAKSKNYNPALYTGQNAKTREQEKQMFKTDPSCKVLFGIISAMGAGLTLTEANTVIFLDEPWNRATKDQCEDRIHRIGTTGPPNIITLMCRNTIDERINDIVYRKGKLSDILIDKEEDVVNNKKLLNYLLSTN